MSMCIPRRSTKSDNEESVGYGLLWMTGNTAAAAVVGYSSDPGSMALLEQSEWGVGGWMISVDAAGATWTLRIRTMHGRRETTSLGRAEMNVFICESGES